MTTPNAVDQVYATQLEALAILHRGDLAADELTLLHDAAEHLRSDRKGVGERAAEMFAELSD